MFHHNYKRETTGIENLKQNHILFVDLDLFILFYQISYTYYCIVLLGK